MIRSLIAALAFAAPAAAQTWIQSPVNGHWYALTGSAMTALNAETVAVGWGGHLATVRSAFEGTWAAQTFSCPGGQPVWVGLTDAPQEGTWQWLSGEPVSFVNWCSGEPGGGSLELSDSTALYCSAVLGGTACLKDAPGDGYDGWLLHGLVERELNPEATCTPQWTVATDFAAGAPADYQLVGGASYLAGAVRLTPATSDVDGTLASVPTSPVGAPAMQLDLDFRTSGGGHIIWLYLADAATVAADQIAPPLDGPSLYLELDFYQNADLGDPNGNHLELRYPTSWQASSQGIYSPAFSMSDGSWHHLRLLIHDGLADVTVWSATGHPETAFTNVPLPGYTPSAWRLMLRGNTGSCAPCVENWVDNIVWTAVDPTVPTVCDVSATSAQNPAPIQVTGFQLGAATGVKLDGTPLPFVVQSDSQLAVTAAPGEPGFHDLRIEFPTSTIDVVAAVALWPTLAASTTGIGGTASIGIRNGTAGIAVVAYAAGLLPPPGIALPPTWSTLKLDITGPYVIVASYGLPTSGELSVAYPIPGDPSLAGSTAHIQAWCQQGFFGPGVTYSFTNAAAVTF